MAEAMELTCHVQKYDWGKLGSDPSAFVAKYYRSAHAANDSQFDVSQPYAELWMGTHPNGPSKKKSTSEHLSGVLGHEIPFLFKVLSIRKALSIQAHPDKERAKQLHAADPEHYPDPNHKPEMAIALTPFKALCGFLPVERIEYYMNAIPSWGLLARGELKTIHEHPKRYLSQLVSMLLHCPKDMVSSGLQSINRDILALKPPILPPSLIDAFQALYRDYPGDPGVFFVFLLNIVHLEPQEAIFLSANEPHAYISGDCMEIMAPSDNVVRAGLTPKFKDVATLCSMLTFSCHEASAFRVLPRRLSKNTVLYQPQDIDDFAVLAISIISDYHVPVVMDAIFVESIMICAQGYARLTVDQQVLSLDPGRVFYLGPEAKVQLLCTHSEPLVVFRAFHPASMDSRK